MASIEQVVSDNLTYLSTPPEFYLGDYSFFNVDLDRETDPETPVALMEHFVDQKVDYGVGGNLFVTSTVYILFLKGYPENDYQELVKDPQINLLRNVTVNEMRGLAYEFIMNMDVDTRLQPQTVHKTQVNLRAVYNLFDSNLDGVEFTGSYQIQIPTTKCVRHSGPMI